MHEYYDQSAVTKPAHKVYIDALESATAIDDGAEPIANVFDQGDDAAQEVKTAGLEGPIIEVPVPMQESTTGAGGKEEDAPIPADDRAPVGLDAGAPEVTGTGHDEGGWHGGANEGAPKEDEPAAKEEPPRGAKVDVPEMAFDDEAQKLAAEAMADDK